MRKLNDMNLNLLGLTETAVDEDSLILSPDSSPAENKDGGIVFATVNGTAGNDVLFGTNANDTINAYGGNDDIHGLDGSDAMYGGAGNDDFYYSNGLDGDLDGLYGGTGTDRMILDGAGTYDHRDINVLSIEEIEFDADGANVDKTLWLSGKELDQAGEFSPTLLIDGNDNSGSNDRINIYLDATYDDVDISGWTFQDWDDNADNPDSLYIYGGAETNTITGSSEDDFVYSGGGNDILNGGAGNDILSGGTENDTLNGGAGADALYGGSGNDSIIGGTGTGANNVYGGAGADTITSSGYGTYRGDAGNDYIYAGNGGNETLDGGTGVDWVNTAAWSGNYVFNMATGVTNYGGESFVNFENAFMGSGSDTITGTSGANAIYTNNGNDIIYGGGGTDNLYGGNDNDTLYGGIGISDNLYGGSGDDTMIYVSGEGYDNFYGGVGTDSVIIETFSSDTLQINLNLGRWGYNDLAFAYDIVGVETVTTGNNDDTITSTFGYQTLYGLGGNDTFIHGDGQFIDDIYGGSGSDTLDASDVTTASNALTIDLLASTWTGLGGTQTLSSIASVIGTQVDDTIISTFGTQTLDGQGGNDTFVHGNGQFIDNIAGGAGLDTLDLSDVTNAGEGVTIDLGAGTWSGLGGSRTISSIETILSTALADDIDLGGVGGRTVFGFNGNDVIEGGFNAQTIHGGAGNDTIDGGFAVGSAVGDVLNGNAGDDSITAADGDDVMNGGAGNDSMSGNGGNDVMAGASGNDVMNGGAGNDDISGNGGDDTITGGDGVDVVNGGGGADNINGGNDNDTLSGATGSDIISGGAGNDSIFGNNQNDTLFGNSGDDSMNGGAGNDLLYGGGNNDTMSGSAGQDTMYGGSGNDNLSGNSGGDDLFGGSGNDLLNGGGGNDEMNGGTGADVFIMNGGFGTDRVEDFQNGVDLVDFSSNGLANNFAQVLAAASQVGANVRIDLNANNILILEGFNLADMDATDFIF